MVPTPAELAGNFKDSISLINTTILRSQGADAALAAPRTGSLHYQFPVNAAGFPTGARYAATSQYVPIANNSVAAQLSQNEFAKFVMSQFPTPQNPGPYFSFYQPDGLWANTGNNVSYLRGVTNVDNRYSVRIDHTITDSDRIFGRYTSIPLESDRFQGCATGNCAASHHPPCLKTGPPNTA